MLGLCAFEEKARARGFSAIAGVDEAGRGPLAGPVVAAACILPEGLLLEGINDSKKLNAAQRAQLFKRLTEDPAIVFGIGIVEARIIDEINILQATFQAMLIAVSHLAKIPDYLLVDGPLLPKTPLPAEAIVDGDALSQSIAAASILAKETRDALMRAYHAQFPAYGFDTHKGYGTAAHLRAIRQHGPCPLHRLSFAPLKSK